MSSTPRAHRHWTTRRRFIATLGFGGVSLYGLWAAYGAAPGPLTLLGLGEAEGAQAGAGGGGHGGHGASQAGPTPEEFRRMTEEFIERYRLPDGTVHPRIFAAVPPGPDEGARALRDPNEHSGHEAQSAGTMDHGAMDHGAMDHGAMHHAATDTQVAGAAGPAHGGHGMRSHGAADSMPAMARGAAQHGAHAGAGGTADAGDPLDVYLAAGMWYYLPNALRLDAGRPYRFRMMALDESHGASIQFGGGARMVRVRPGRVTEAMLTFPKPGRYLVYCTVYCGPAHDTMQATIEVA